MKLLKIIFFGIFVIWLSDAPLRVDVTVEKEDTELRESVMIQNDEFIEHLKDLLSMTDKKNNVDYNLFCFLSGTFKNPEMNVLFSELILEVYDFHTIHFMRKCEDSFRFGIKVVARKLKQNSTECGSKPSKKIRNKAIKNKIQKEYDVPLPLDSDLSTMVTQKTLAELCAEFDREQAKRPPIGATKNVQKRFSALSLEIGQGQYNKPIQKAESVREDFMRLLNERKTRS